MDKAQDLHKFYMVSVACCPKENAVQSEFHQSAGKFNIFFKLILLDLKI